MKNSSYINKKIIFIVTLSLLLSPMSLSYGEDKKLLKNPIQLITDAKDVRPPNLCIRLNTTMNSIVTSFNAITDVASAKAALPELTLATNKLGELSEMMDQIPAVGVGQVSMVVTKRAPERQAAINKLNNIPGVSEVIKPVVANLAEKEAIYENFLKNNSNK